MPLSCDIFLSGVLAQVSLDKLHPQWDQNFTDSGYKPVNKLLCHVDNYAYLRIFSPIEEGATVSMCLSRGETSHIQLFTDMGLAEQKIRKGEDDFSTNAHPFILSGLYDWSGYTLTAFIDGAEACSCALTMDDDDPYVIRKQVPAWLERCGRIEAACNDLDLFDVVLSPSMKRDVGIDVNGESVFFNGTCSSRAQDAATLYLTLKDGKSPPSSLKIQFSEADSE